MNDCTVSQQFAGWGLPEQAVIQSYLMAPYRFVFPIRFSTLFVKRVHF